MTICACQGNKVLSIPLQCQQQSPACPLRLHWTSQAANEMPHGAHPDYADQSGHMQDASGARASASSFPTHLNIDCVGGLKALDCLEGLAATGLNDRVVFQKDLAGKTPQHVRLAVHGGQDLCLAAVQPGHDLQAAGLPSAASRHLHQPAHRGMCNTVVQLMRCSLPILFCMQI